jgi:hypothetical protein
LRGFCGGQGLNVILPEMFRATIPLDTVFSICSYWPMQELAFKIVKLDEGRTELVAQIDNFAICKAAFEKALFVYPNEHLELRNGARIILSSKEE